MGKVRAIYSACFACSSPRRFLRATPSVQSKRHSETLKTLALRSGQLWRAQDWGPACFPSEARISVCMCVCVVCVCVCVCVCACMCVCVRGGREGKRGLQLHGVFEDSCVHRAQEWGPACITSEARISVCMCVCVCVCVCEGGKGGKKGLAFAWCI